MSQAVIIFAAITLAVPAHAQQSTFTNSTGRYSGAWLAVVVEYIGDRALASR